MRKHLHAMARPWFVILTTVTLLHQVLQKALNISIPIIDNYLDPLLMMPIVLQLILTERRIFRNKGDNYILPISHLIILFVFVALITEYFFPIWRSGFTRDIWDIVLYAIGTFAFGIFWNKPLQMHNSNE